MHYITDGHVGNSQFGTLELEAFIHSAYGEEDMLSNSINAFFFYSKSYSFQLREYILKLPLSVVM